MIALLPNRAALSDLEIEQQHRDHEQQVAGGDREAALRREVEA